MAVNLNDIANKTMKLFQSTLPKIKFPLTTLKKQRKKLISKKILFYESSLKHHYQKYKIYLSSNM